MPRHDVRAGLHRDRYHCSCARELDRDLPCRIARTHNQHAAAGKTARAAVVGTVHDAATKPIAAGELGRPWVRNDARGNDETLRVECPAVARSNRPAILVARDARDFDTGLNRQTEAFGVPFEVVDEVPPCWKEWRLPAEGETRKRGEMLAGVKNEAVVQVAPRVAELVAAFETDTAELSAGSELAA